MGTIQDNFIEGEILTILFILLELIVYAHAVQVSQSCKELLKSCSFGGIEFECLDIFSNILTDEGLCCIFNGVHKKFVMKTQYK